MALQFLPGKCSETEDEMPAGKKSLKGENTHLPSLAIVQQQEKKNFSTVCKKCYHSLLSNKECVIIHLRNVKIYLFWITKFAPYSPQNRKLEAIFTLCNEYETHSACQIDWKNTQWKMQNARKVPLSPSPIYGGERRGGGEDFCANMKNSLYFPPPPLPGCFMFSPEIRSYLLRESLHRLPGNFSSHYVPVPEYSVHCTVCLCTICEFRTLWY